jgi:hypothetical protein
MKLRGCFIGFIMLFLLTSQFAQSNKKDTSFYPFKHCTYLEILGNAQSLLSLNYERILNAHSRSKTHYSLRSGIGFYKRRQDTVWVFNVPLELNFIYGKKRHYIESSVGYTASFGKKLIDSTTNTAEPPKHFEKTNRIYIFRLGYRYMYEGLLIRLTPLFIYNANYVNSAINFSGCISLGLAF